MAKFRKKPVVIEAIRWTGEYDSMTDRPEWFEEACVIGTVLYNLGGPPVLTVKTLEGDHYAQPGDMIIRGIKGELYPCKPDIFEATYDSAE
jgi:hypothetical protein